MIYDRAGGSASVCSGATIKPIHIIIACHHDVASIGGVPINEFTTDGYFSCAFPTLFPTGAGDFSGQRQNQVTIGNYFKHLMMYDDNRFAKHPRFRFFAVNTEMRWRALQTGRVYVKQHPGDAQLSLDELRDMVGTEGETFSNRVSTVSERTKTFLTVICCSQVSMHLSISHSLCSAVHNYDSLCRRSSRSPIMLSILLVNYLVATSFKSHEICRINCLIALHIPHVVLAITLYTTKMRCCHLFCILLNM